MRRGAAMAALPVEGGTQFRPLVAATTKAPGLRRARGARGCVGATVIGRKKVRLLAAGLRLEAIGPLIGAPALP